MQYYTHGEQKNKQTKKTPKPHTLRNGVYGSMSAKTNTLC